MGDGFNLDEELWVRKDVASNVKTSGVRKSREQALRLQIPLFWVVVTIASVCTGASTVFIFVWLCAFPPVPASVGVAYISGLTIEAVGVVAIMVRSLFHSRGIWEKEK